MAGLVVATKYGKVEGTERGAVSVWKGLPYAAPPVGKLRFRPPQPPAAWDGVRSATQYSPVVPQLDGGMGNLLGSIKFQQSEADSLTLNIWSPGADDKKRPVLFWIHGGGFTNGTGATPWYNGTSFAEKGDVVVVTINYRLGALGFLHLAALGGEAFDGAGNVGILDQVAALQWVRDNIAAFGGDPANITIFGESAGAMSVGTLLALPAARGLFKRAILQSGAAHAVADAESAGRVATKFIKLLELDTSNVAALQEMPVEKILEAQAKLAASGGGMAFRPVVDGTYLPQLPIEAIRNGSAKAVDVLIGWNYDEMKLFTLMNRSQATPDTKVLEQLFGARADEAIAAYMTERPGADATEAWIDVLNDRTFRIPAIRVAEAQAQQNAPVWMYRFDWPSTAFGGKLGACHALEIPFVFNTLDKAEMFTGNAPERQQIADKMQAAWLAFARSGNPYTSELPEWPSYDTSRRATLLFNTECRVTDNPQATTRELWQGVL